MLRHVRQLLIEVVMVIPFIAIYPNRKV